MNQSLFKFHTFMIVNILVAILASSNTHAETHSEKMAADLKEGKRIYSVSCVLCHGDKGKGDGPASIFIGPYSHPRPNNFTGGAFKYRTTESGDLPTLSDLQRTIRYGIPGYMPSFKHLEEEGIRQVALYVATTFIEDELPVEPFDELVKMMNPADGAAANNTAYAALPLDETPKPRKLDIFEEMDSRTAGTEQDFPLSDNIVTAANTFSDNPVNATNLLYRPKKNARINKRLVALLKKMSHNVAANTSRIAGVEQRKDKSPQTRRSLQASIARGKVLFHEMQCISCHGVTGKGAKTNMKDERGLHIMAADLSQPSTFANGNEKEDIFRTIMTGLNGTPMPSFIDLFIGQEDRAWDLVEYVYSLREDSLAGFLP